MKKKITILLSVIALFTMLFITNTYAYSNATIPPTDSVYKEGIYRLDPNDTGSYNLQFKFLNPEKNSAIIILDENADIVYKNINCNRKCNAGTVTNKNTIILISDGETALYFSKTP